MQWRHTGQIDLLVTHAPTTLPQVARPACTNPFASPLYVGAANATNLDRLHRALNGWRSNCDGTIIFTEPGAVFVLEGGYNPTNVSLTLDASGSMFPSRSRIEAAGWPRAPC